MRLPTTLHSAASDSEDEGPAAPAGFPHGHTTPQSVLVIPVLNCVRRRVWPQVPTPPPVYHVWLDYVAWASIYTLLLWTALRAYSAALLGGSLGFVKDHLVDIGKHLITSCAAWILLCFMVPFLPLAPSRRTLMVRVGAGAIALVLMSAVIASDQGSDFLNHGEYNMFIFVAATVPVVATGTAFILSARKFGIARTSKWWGGTCAVGAVGIALSAWYASAAWGHGLLGRSMDSDMYLEAASASSAAQFRTLAQQLQLALPAQDSPFKASVCRIVRPGSSIPWPSMLPDGAMNFMFNAACKPHRAAVRWEEDVLHMACPPAQHAPAAGATVDWSAVPWWEAPPALFDDRPVTAIPGDITYAMPHGPAHRHVYTQPVAGLPFDLVRGACPGDAVTSLAWRVLPKPALQAGVHFPGVQQPRADTAAAAAASKPMNVLVLMIDAVSREHFHRKLTSVSSWLEAAHGHGVRVHEFFRAHAVGYNTGPNTGALYAGLKSKADAMSAFLHQSEGPFDPQFTVTDELLVNRAEVGQQLYWALAQAAGAVTSSIQGMCQSWTGTYPHVPGAGLHYDMFAPFCDREAHPYPRPFSNLEGPFSIVRRCLRGKPVHSWIFDWLKQHRELYSHRHTWTTAMFMEGHEGTGEVISTMDDDLAEFLQGMTGCTDGSRGHVCAGGALENTLVVLLADHGGHMGPYPLLSNTGRAENQLPLLMVLAPEPWLEQRPDIARALEVNQFRLVSPFDVYHGLVSLLHLPEFHNATLAAQYPAWHKHAERSAAEERTQGMRGTAPTAWTHAPGVYETDAVVPPARLAKALKSSQPMAGIFTEQPADRSCEAANIPAGGCVCDAFPNLDLM